MDKDIELIGIDDVWESEGSSTDLIFIASSYGGGISERIKNCNRSQECLDSLPIWGDTLCS